MPFLTACILRDDGAGWITHAPLIFERPSGEIITVPAGTHTDLASVPRPLWSLFPRDGEYRVAAVLHDYAVTRMPWGEAATVLSEAIEALGVTRWKRWAIVAGVRAAGLWRA